jgi:protein-L-isoaspartate(D-aspartate) O-methyltransferase
MLVPVGTRDAQRLQLVTRTTEGYEVEDVTECTFVPLVGRFGWSDGGRVEG